MKPKAKFSFGRWYCQSGRYGYQDYVCGIAATPVGAYRKWEESNKRRIEREKEWEK